MMAVTDTVGRKRWVMGLTAPVLNQLLGKRFLENLPVPATLSSEVRIVSVPSGAWAQESHWAHKGAGGFGAEAHQLGPGGGLFLSRRTFVTFTASTRKLGQSFPCWQKPLAVAPA